MHNAAVFQAACRKHWLQPLLGVMKQTFQERLRALREERGLRVNELERLAGVSTGSVSRFEYGDRKVVGSDILAKLAAALGVSMDVLWGEEPAAASIPPVLAATFLMEVDSRKLRSVIEKDPGRWHLATVAAAMAAPVRTDAQGVPVGGWTKLLSEVESGSARVTAARPVAAPRRRRA